MSRPVRLILIFFGIFLILDLGLLGYFFVLKKPPQNQKQVVTIIQSGSISELAPKVIGATFGENKFWDVDQLEWTIQFVSNGKLLDYIERPVKIPVSSTENVEMLVGIKGYYFDAQGKLSSLIFPIVVNMPNGKMYYLGGPLKNNEVEWKKSEILQEVRKKAQKYLNFVGETPGAILMAIIVTDVPARNSHFNRVPDPEKDSFDYIDNIASGFQNMNREKFDKFFSSGDPEIGYLISNGFGASFLKINYSLEK